jgi:hypothetical protein
MPLLSPFAAKSITKEGLDKEWLQPFKGGQMATQRNYLILRDQTQSSAVLGCAADHQGKSQAIDFQCCIFAPLKGWDIDPTYRVNLVKFELA